MIKQANKKHQQQKYLLKDFLMHLDPSKSCPWFNEGMLENLSSHIGSTACFCK